MKRKSPVSVVLGRSARLCLDVADMYCLDAFRPSNESVPFVRRVFVSSLSWTFLRSFLVVETEWRMHEMHRLARGDRCLALVFKA